ncbi:hypothetical protein [Mycobacterium riyadhense]|uniref:hypothetical protein n=1 Tax=Mycobacterium riyadhense TaxID=486698 RepID=UPI001951EA4A|nr:hypothetical protein [Mycobacterium riyadhense]
MNNAAPEPFDLDALRQAVEVAVREALDTPEFHAAVDEAVNRFLADLPPATNSGSVAREIEAAVKAPVWREVLLADELPEGVTDPLLAVQREVGDIASQIKGAIRDALRRATG